MKKKKLYLSIAFLFLHPYGVQAQERLSLTLAEVPDKSTSAKVRGELPERAASPLNQKEVVALASAATQSQDNPKIQASSEVRDDKGAAEQKPKQPEQVALTSDGFVFNTSFLRGNNTKVDINDLLSNGVVAGTYEVSILLNNRLKLKQDVQFLKNERTAQVEACITYDILKQLHVDVDMLAKQNKINPEDHKSCLDLSMIMEKASQSYEPGKFRLSLSIPQVYLLPEAASYVDPKLWDYGITAGFINYNASISRANQSQRGNSESTTRISSSLNNGINLLGWRYRNASSLAGTTGEKFEFSSFTNYVEHDVDMLKAQVRIGDVFASSRLLDSVGIRGIQLSDDLSMQPWLDQSHRPVVRGFAETNATVEVRQHNFLIYTAKVPPGMFELTDINSAGSTGDLEIKIIEADGRERINIQPWGTTAYMVKKGFFTYDAAIGQYRQYGNDAPSLNVASLDYTYGVAENLSILGGVQIADGYQAIGLGLGTNTFLGPVAVDLQQSFSTIDGKRSKGSSVRFSYSKDLNEYGTNFALVSQRFSTENFRSLSTHAQYLDKSLDHNNISAPKLSSSISVNQNFRERGWGSLYASLSDNRYWGDSGGSTSISAGYSNNWGTVSYGINLTQTRNLAVRGIDAKNDTAVGFSLSFPLGSSSRPISVSASVNSSSSGPTTTSTSLSSNIDIMGNKASYAVYASGEKEKFDSYGANLNSRTPYVGYSVSASSGKNYSTYGANLNGGILFHSGGINFNAGMNETVILADLAGQEGVEVNYSAKTGTNGYAVIPSAVPYQINQVLVGKNLPSGVDLVDGGNVTVVPRRGAIVRAQFEIKTGRRIEFVVTDANGKKVPFGTYLFDEEGNRLGITDPMGKALVLLQNDSGTITVQVDDASCTASYNLGPKDPNLYYDKVSLQCAKPVAKIAAVKK